jgi:hypothetical protein
MSYVPIYNKLHELETRVSTLENAPLAAAPEVSVAITPVSVPAPAAPVASAASVKDEHPDVSGFAAYATKDELPDVSGFATKDELPDVSGFATKDELPDVSGFATKDELPDVSGFATKAELADLYSKFENAVNVIAQLNTKIIEANEKIAALEAA